MSYLMQHLGVTHIDTAEPGGPVHGREIGA